VHPSTKTTEYASSNFHSMLKLLFQPLTRLCIALACAAFFALCVLCFTRGDQQHFYLYYYLPIGIPFVLLLLERAANGWDQWQNQHAPIQWASLLVDIPVIGMALLRSVTLVPGYSGHALFLGYALFASRTWLTRLAAGLVLLQVAYLKILVWHDNTIYGGLLLSLAAAGLWRYLTRAGNQAAN